MDNTLCRQCRSENSATDPKCRECGASLLPKWDRSWLLGSSVALLVAIVASVAAAYALWARNPEGVELVWAIVLLVSPVIVLLVGLLVCRRDVAGGFAERAIRGAKDHPDHALADMMHALQLDPKLVDDARKVAQRVWRQRPAQAVELLETALENCLEPAQRAPCVALRGQIGRGAQIRLASALPGLLKTLDALQAEITRAHGEEKHQVLTKRAEVLKENGIALTCASCNREGTSGGMEYVVFGKQISPGKSQAVGSRHGWICGKCGWTFIAREGGAMLFSVVVCAAPILWASWMERTAPNTAPKWFLAVAGVAFLVLLFYVFWFVNSGHKRFGRSGRRSVLLALVRKQLPDYNCFWSDSVGLTLTTSDEVARPTVGDASAAPDQP